MKSGQQLKLNTHLSPAPHAESSLSALLSLCRPKRVHSYHRLKGTSYQGALMDTVIPVPRWNCWESEARSLWLHLHRLVPGQPAKAARCLVPSPLLICLSEACKPYINCNFSSLVWFCLHESDNIWDIIIKQPISPIHFLLYEDYECTASASGRIKQRSLLYSLSVI